MTRQLLFKHYVALALVGTIAGVAAVLKYAPAERVPLIGSVLGAALAFCYFVQQQKLAETALFKELFMEFNRRYDEMNDRLAQIVASGTQPDAAARQTVVDYFNLCAEEYLFYSEGYIHLAAWQSWCAGMVWYFDREPFRSIWSEESATNSYYGLSLEAIRHAAVRQRHAAAGPARRR